MAAIYLSALAVAVFVLLLQLFLSGSGGEAEVEADADHDSGGDAHGVAALFLSTRFWTFALLGFGLAGALLHFFRLAGTTVTLLLAAASGLLAGSFAVLVFRALVRTSTGSVVASSHAVGKIGKVLVPLGRGRIGQVRIELGGNTVDLLATSDDEEIGRGDRVLVDAVNGGVAQVSPLPRELE